MKITKISLSIYFLAALVAVTGSNAQSGKTKKSNSPTVKPTASAKKEASSENEKQSTPAQPKSNLPSAVTTKIAAPTRITAFAPEIGTLSVKDDSFSDKRKVLLSKTVIAPDAAFTLEGDFAKSRTYNPLEIDTTPVLFALALLNRPTRTVTGEMNFLVDGKRIEGGEIKSNITLSIYAGDEFDTKGIDAPFVYISFRSLEKIGQGKKVQVKIADNVYDVDQDVVKAIKDFTTHVR